jgi:hypothetical protein
VSDYETSEGFFTRTQTPGDGDSPHGATRIWYSKDLEQLITSPPYTAPPGATAIKEADGNKDGTVNFIMVMTKQPPGYDPDNGDWYYERREYPSGAVVDEGALAGCITCHDAGKDTVDYLLGTELVTP